MNVNGARDICIELNSLSKSFNMAGWRLGFAVANPEYISNILKVKSNVDSGMVMGSGGPSIENVILAADKTREKNPKKMGPFIVPRTMASTASATLAVPFKIKGVN